MIPVRTFVNASNPVLFRHWVRYYKALGCDKFLLVINYLEDEDAGRIREIIQDEKIDTMTWDWKGIYSSPEKDAYIDRQMDTLQDLPCEYVVNVDMDEFVEFPVLLPDLLDKLKSLQSERVVGFFIDRISEKLKPLEPSKNIFEQAPLNAQITKRLAKGYTLKNPITICSIRPHRAWHIKKKYPSNYPHMVPIYHFKWFTGLKEYVRERYNYYKNQNIRQFGESKRIYNFISKGRNLKKFCVPDGDKVSYKEHEYRVDWVSRRERIIYLHEGMYP
jgi:hypothetical protein